jgi:hypothetical protein
MEAVSTSETLANFYQTAWHSIQEDCHLQGIKNLLGLPPSIKDFLGIASCWLRIGRLTNAICTQLTIFATLVKNP